MDTALAELPIALRRVLTEILDLGLQERLEQVLLAAARAITHLRDLDLSKYETDTADEDQSLELLEMVAPVLAATVMDVNALVSAIDESFPRGARLTEGDPIDLDKAQRAVDILRTRSATLRSGVLQLGIQLRSPRAVADRWNFLNHLQTARGLLRVGIGEMVADAAGIYAEVPRVSVIPEYQKDIDNAVGLRRTLHRLALGLRTHLRRLGEQQSIPLPQLLAGLSETMEKLSKTGTWRELRAPDKKEFVKFRVQLRELLARHAPEGPALEALKGFVSFLELLGVVINQRETLRTHDQACLAELTAQLEHLEGLPAPRRVGMPMAKVVTLCERLRGRDEFLDAFIAGLKATPNGDAAQIVALREHAQRLLMR